MFLSRGSSKRHLKRMRIQFIIIETHLAGLMMHFPCLYMLLFLSLGRKRWHFFYCRPVNSLLGLDVSAGCRGVLLKTQNFFKASSNLWVVKLFIASRCVCVCVCASVWWTNSFSWERPDRRPVLRVHIWTHTRWGVNTHTACCPAEGNIFIKFIERMILLQCILSTNYAGNHFLDS